MNSLYHKFLHIGLKYIQKEISKVAPKILHDNPIFKEEIEKRKKNNKSLVESEDCKKFKEKIKNIPTELQQQAQYIPGSRATTDIPPSQCNTNTNGQS